MDDENPMDGRHGTRDVADQLDATTERLVGDVTVFVEPRPVDPFGDEPWATLRVVARVDQSHDSRVIELAQETSFTSYEVARLVTVAVDGHAFEDEFTHVTFVGTRRPPDLYRRFDVQPFVQPIGADPRVVRHGTTPRRLRATRTPTK